MMPVSRVPLFPEAGDPWVHLSSAPSPALCQRSRGRKHGPRGFNHFAIKAELLSALIQAELLGVRLARPRSSSVQAPTSDDSCKMEHSSLILPLNQGT